MSDPIWLAKAKTCLGLAAGREHGDNPAVLAFYKDAGHPEIAHDTVPWCAAFVGGILARCGLPNTKSLLALSYQHYGKALPRPAVGAIATKTRIGGGHVFFVAGFDDAMIYALGGNQGHMVCIEAIPRSEVLSYAWPLTNAGLVPEPDYSDHGVQAETARLTLQPAPIAKPAQAFPPEIIAAAQASERATGIPASVTLAQWAIESGFGRHMPEDSNNPFGIKARPGEPFVAALTREVIGGKDVAMQQDFRKFDNFSDAFTAHGHLLATANPYVKARAMLPDADAFAKALTGTYATDPHYGPVLIGVMRKYDLYRFDRVAASHVPPILRPAHLATGAAMAGAVAAQAHAASGGHWVLTALLVAAGVAGLVFVLAAWRKNFRIDALVACVDPASQAVPAVSLAQAQST